MESRVVSAIHHLKISQEYFEDFSREYKGSIGKSIFKGYIKKVKWILTDMITQPFFPDVVREGIRREVNSDIMAIPSINEKIALLNPDQRAIIEETIDQVLSGEVELKNV